MFVNNLLSNSYTDLSGTGAVLRKYFSLVFEKGHFVELLVVHDVCTGVGRAVHHDLQLLRADLDPVCSCSFRESVGEIWCSLPPMRSISLANLKLEIGLPIEIEVCWFWTVSCIIFSNG
ncbi:hypothetical protein DPMN_181386 [Dreissena polymorpha]|uniref:Uncharacterized protein n=1 Tax=Dreissena polymorpha TaxID=45954 RepID=A0A9D4I1K4_DREPO|nr:hypothetical protein DPMN_181386 [Dreissena polymorpha]